MNIHTLVLLKNKAQLSPGSPSSLPLVWSSLTCTTESAPGRASEESGQEGKSSQFHQDIDQDLHFGWRSLLPSRSLHLDSWSYSYMRSSLAPLKYLQVDPSWSNTHCGVC